MQLIGQNEQRRVTLTVTNDPAGAPMLTVGGAARFLVESVDVREAWQARGCRE